MPKISKGGLIRKKAAQYYTFASSSVDSRRNSAHEKRSEDAKSDVIHDGLRTVPGKFTLRQEVEQALAGMWQSRRLCPRGREHERPKALDESPRATPFGAE